MGYLAASVASNFVQLYPDIEFDMGEDDVYYPKFIWDNETGTLYW